MWGIGGKGQNMLGAIIGDIVGSIYEPKDRRIKTKYFPFFGEDCRFTDDSVCTTAVADALLHDLPPAETMRKWGKRYPRCGFSQIFKDWIYAEADAPLTALSATVRRCASHPRRS